MPTEPITFSWLANKAWVLLVGWFWHEKKQSEKKDEKRDARLTKLELDFAKANYVTEDQVRNIVQKALGPYKEDQQEIKSLLKELNSNVASLSRDMAVQNAIRSLNEQTPHDSSGGH